MSLSKIYACAAITRHCTPRPRPTRPRRLTGRTTGPSRGSPARGARLRCGAPPFFPFAYILSRETARRDDTTVQNRMSAQTIRDCIAGRPLLPCQVLSAPSLTRSRHDDGSGHSKSDSHTDNHNDIILPFRCRVTSSGLASALQAVQNSLR